MSRGSRSDRLKSSRKHPSAPRAPPVLYNGYTVMVLWFTVMVSAAHDRAARTSAPTGNRGNRARQRAAARVVLCGVRTKLLRFRGRRGRAVGKLIRFKNAIMKTHRNDGYVTTRLRTHVRDVTRAALYTRCRCQITATPFAAAAAAISPFSRFSELRFSPANARVFTLALLR